MINEKKFVFCCSFVTVTCPDSLRRTILNHTRTIDAIRCTSSIWWTKFDHRESSEIFGNDWIIDRLRGRAEIGELLSIERISSKKPSFDDDKFTMACREPPDDLFRNEFRKLKRKQSGRIFRVLYAIAEMCWCLLTQRSESANQSKWYNSLSNINVTIIESILNFTETMKSITRIIRTNEIISNGPTHHELIIAPHLRHCHVGPVHSHSQVNNKPCKWNFKSDLFQ